METKKDILWRIYLVYLAISLFGVLIIVKISIIQFSEGEKWKNQAQDQTMAYRSIEALRGNIFDTEGNLLATSLPYYEVGMDVNTEYLTKDLFAKNIDSLSLSLAKLFKDRSKNEYRSLLLHARKSGDRYVPIKKDVSYNELQALKKFPLFRLSRYKGGFISLQTNKRERPFKILAARTIGYQREDVQPVGLEGAYDDSLKGISGKRLMQKIAGGVWIPVNDENEIDPQDGCDLVTSIDINIQDVAEHALLEQLIKNKAAYGCVVLMEVATGDIKAIANLSRKDSSTYYENFNYAIGTATEPGSTFKLASLLAAMEDGLEPTDIVDLENGTHAYYNRVMKDSHEPEVRKVSVHRIFEISSNVGISKIITQHYSKDPQKFIDRLYSMNLNKPLGLSIPGEAIPMIKQTKDKDWSGVSLPWISIGYESLVTPLQTLTLYNAVANDGVMVRPKFVKEIKRRGKTIKSFGTEIINPSICSKSTIDKAKRMLEGVVQNGTAINLKAASYKIAGKTGTAQIANKGLYKNNNNVSYQASFVGYFPADKPKYSCIVLVNGPSNGIYYANVVAGPIFREIADKVYSTSLEIHEQINLTELPIAVKVPLTKSGKKEDVDKIIAELNIPITGNMEDEWVSVTANDSTSLKYNSRNIQAVLNKNNVPNVVGMTAKDAVYLLENKGLQVKIFGKGAVTKQSLEAGTKITKGAPIVLELI